MSSCVSSQLNSLASQISAHVQRLAEHVDARLADVHIDIASGESEVRTDFLRMMNDVENDKLNLIITKSISRFGCNTEDTINAIRKCKEHNVQVFFEEENIDTYKDSSEFIITVLAAYAQADNESRRENQLWSIRKRVEDGTSEYYFRKCYGYTKDKDGRLIIKPEEAEVVQMIFKSYLNGSSIIGIQKELQNQGILSPTGKESWSRKSIENILTNEKYTGSVIVMKTRTLPDKGHKSVENRTEDKYMVSDFHAAIITKEIFDAVQAERDRKSNIVTDETGTHRKSEKYSSKQNI